MTNRILSIQSHVVFGYVGNKSAVFPLQVLGFEVDPLNSVQLSNHTGYEFFDGHVLDSTELDALLNGLQKNQLDNYSHLLTGYINSVSFLRRVSKLCQHLKQKNPNFIYGKLFVIRIRIVNLFDEQFGKKVCDPVMGDNGSMYVSKDLFPVYRDEIVPNADILTPNQFEIELLSGIKISSVESAWKAMNVIHAKGCRNIVVSSTDLGDDSKLIGLASCCRLGPREGDAKTTAGDATERYIIEIPKFQAKFTGTGDVFASLFLAWFTKSGGDVKSSLEKTIASMQAILKRTLNSIENNEGESSLQFASVRALELKLIQSLDDIRNPTVLIQARSV